MAHSNSRAVRRIFAACCIAAAGMSVAACDEDPEFAVYRARRDGITPGLGNSVAHNIAVQTIDPWPPNVRNARINVDGERLLLAARRYQANKSIPPKGLATQTISTGNGNSGGSGAPAN